MENKFYDFCKKYADEINVSIHGVLAMYIDKYSYNESLRNYFKLLDERCKNGKRIRAYLIKLGYILAGKEYTEEILLPSIAIEIFQTSILIHDDIIDKSETRRNIPTIHVALGNNHEAMSKAICIGDLGFSISSMLINDSKFPEKNKIRAMYYFQRLFLNTCLGEILDISLSNIFNTDKQDIIDMYTLKTSYYTISGPLQIGASLAGASDEVLALLEELGRYVGICFQIQDDFLGMFGNEDITGKPTISDIQEGKTTILSWYAFKNASEKQQIILSNIYGTKQDITADAAETIRNIFTETGAVDYCGKQKEFYLNESYRIITLLENFISKSYTEILNDFVKYIIEREK